jgi:tetratricopeptide (TPR) repeat protein
MLICVAVLVLFPFGLAFQAAPPAELLTKANDSYQARQFSEAVRLYRQYLAGDPDNNAVRIYLGAALFSAGQHIDAEKEARQVLDSDPNFAKAYVLLGRIYSAEEAWAAAQKAFDRAIRLNAADRDALYFSGRAYYDANFFGQAITRFKQLLSLDHTQSRTYENLGLCYEALGFSMQAEEAYRHAVELAGNRYRPYFAYGVFLF